MNCPVCNRKLEEHGEIDCLIPLLNEIDRLKRELSRYKEALQIVLEAQRSVIGAYEALKQMGYRLDDSKI